MTESKTVLKSSVVSVSLRPHGLACQAPLSMGFPRQEHWTELPFSSPGNHPDPRIKPRSPAPPAWAGRFFTTAPLGMPMVVKDSFIGWETEGEGT